MGDTLDSVEALIKKHENFEQSLAAQEEKFKALEESASRLIQAGHYAAEEIDSKRKTVSILSLLFVVCCLLFVVVSPAN